MPCSGPKKRTLSRAPIVGHRAPAAGTRLRWINAILICYEFPPPEYCADGETLR
jgi:hypothetical protein